MYTTTVSQGFKRQTLVLVQSLNSKQYIKEDGNGGVGKETNWELLCRQKGGWERDPIKVAGSGGWAVRKCFPISEKPHSHRWGVSPPFYPLHSISTFLLFFLIMGGGGEGGVQSLWDPCESHVAPSPSSTAVGVLECIQLCLPDDGVIPSSSSPTPTQYVYATPRTYLRTLLFHLILIIYYLHQYYTPPPVNHVLPNGFVGFLSGHPSIFHIKLIVTVHGLRAYSSNVV